MFIICYSVDNEQSLTDACTKWIKEIENTGPKNAARILVATKIDLRDEKDKNCI